MSEKEDFLLQNSLLHYIEKSSNVFALENRVFLFSLLLKCPNFGHFFLKKV